MGQRGNQFGDIVSLLQQLGNVRQAMRTNRIRFLHFFPAVRAEKGDHLNTAPFGANVRGNIIVVPVWFLLKVSASLT
jgi:hypothetical protein